MSNESNESNMDANETDTASKPKPKLAWARPPRSMVKLQSTNSSRNLTQARMTAFQPTQRK
ncbi:hypothetical protein P3342_004988 [Pyrenophora teres f. teres]|nr:hypothetical protein P3342_004988 [Pyrenophora teres f. teres]